MSSRLVLVDSSAWVNYLVDQKSGVWDRITGLLQDHRVAANEVVRLEVLTGARDETEYAELADQFEGLYPLPFTGAVWKRAERLRFDLRRKGHVIPTPDILIAACAVIYDCELLHTDKHFDLIHRYVPLKIF